MSECYTDPSAFNIALGVTLTLGILLSYIPQVLSISKAKSSEGVSYWSVWLLYCSSLLTFYNDSMLKWDVITCCRHLPVYKIPIQLLSLEQLLPGTIMSFIILIFIIIYFPPFKIDLESDSSSDDLDSIYKKRDSYIFNLRLARVLLLFAICFTFVLGILCLSLMTLVPDSTQDYWVQYFADLLGLLAAVIVVIVWTPQIYTTWKAKDPGRLSIIMLCVQMPGSLIIVVYQGVFNHASWTTWLPYVCNAAELLLLVVMWFYFSFFVEKEEKDLQVVVDVEEDDYRERLLSHPPSGPEIARVN